jgi:hypothetical protein
MQIDLPRTPREFTKFFVNRLVALGSYQASMDLLETHTEIDTDNFVVKAGCWTGGEVVAAGTSGTTDAAVDKTLDFVASKWRERKAKKAEKTPTEN